MPTLGWNKLLPQVEEFRYLKVLFISEGIRVWDTDEWIAAASGWHSGMDK